MDLSSPALAPSSISLGLSIPANPCPIITQPALVPTHTHHMITRTQYGTRRPKVYFSSRHPIPACFMADFAAHFKESTSYVHALKSPQWKQAMQDEIHALHANCTWSLVPRCPYMNFVRNKWVFKVKTNANGSLESYKAQLVARGFTQLHSLDYDETFSPVVKLGTIHLILTLALSQGWSLKQIMYAMHF